MISKSASKTCVVRRREALPLRAATTSSSSSSILTSFPPILPIPPGHASGLDPSADGPQALRTFTEHISNNYLPVELSQWTNETSSSSIRVHCIDPPVITIDNFLDGSVCDEMIREAQGTGRMETSKIGGKNLTGSDVESIRTSRTLALTSDVLKSHLKLAEALDAILSSANKLLPSTPTSGGNARFVKPSVPGQIVFELPQVAHYANAQHFLSHEDGFPRDIALKKGVQRRATLLVYLNDVPEGGKTTFDFLSLSISPVKGRALLFFPSFKGCVSDGRTLHKAEDVTSSYDKWISQIWISSALPAPPKKAGGKVELPPGLKTARRGNPGR